MSNTYLQDFGLLRKQMNDREVNDPMSGSGRWDDLQMDLRQPHIPKPRRDNMPANRKLTIAGMTIDIKKPDAKFTAPMVRWPRPSVGMSAKLGLPPSQAWLTSIVRRSDCSGQCGGSGDEVCDL